MRILDISDNQFCADAIDLKIIFGKHCNLSLPLYLDQYYDLQ